MLFVFLEISDVDIAVGVNFYAVSTLIVIIKAPLVDFALVVDKHSFPMPSITMNSSKIYLIRIFNQSDFINLLINNLLDIDVGVGKWYILDEVITELLLVFVEYILDNLLLIYNL